MLLIDNVSVRVNVVDVGHELHISPPVNVAPANSKSPEVQEVFGGGNACPNDIVILNKVNISNAKIFFEIVFFGFIRLNLGRIIVENIFYTEEVAS